MNQRRNDDRPRTLWERPAVYVPMMVFCLLVWWVVVAAVIKLWPV
jgi:hypothetical protein